MRTNDPWQGFVLGVKSFNIDIDPAAYFLKRIRSDVPIVGPVPSGLEEMLSLVEGGTSKLQRRSLAGGSKINEWRWCTVVVMNEASDKIKPQAAIEACWRMNN